MNELTMDRIRIAKMLLAEKGIKVFQKDIKKVEKHGFPIPSDDGELFDHREIWLVVMKSGKRYEILIGNSTRYLFREKDKWFIESEK